MNPNRARISICLLAGLLSNALALGEAVNVPPVEISGLVHRNSPGDASRSIADGVTFPSGPGVFFGPGFTASIRQGDTITARFQAPAGRMFVVRPHPQATLSSFQFNAHWAAGNDTVSHSATPTFRFENLSGPSPVNTYQFDSVSDLGNVVQVVDQFTFTAPFSFTAMQVDFTVPQWLAGLAKTYSSVSSFSDFSFSAGSQVPLSAPDRTIMSIELVPCPATLALLALGGPLLARRRVPTS